MVGRVEAAPDNHFSASPNCRVRIPAVGYVKVRWDAFAGASERQKASSVPVTIIEQIAAAQKNRASSGLRLNKPD